MRLRRLFRHVLFWGIPIVAMFLLVITGFLYWLVATPTGTRWVLNTAAVQFEGESRGVQGSLWHGLSFDHLWLQLPNELDVKIDNAHLEIDWPQLWQSKQLLVKDLSAKRVTVRMDGEPTPEDPDAPPFEMLELPISVQIDRLALGKLSFTQQGERLPVDLSQLQLDAELFLDNAGAKLDLRSARVGYEDIWLDADGTATLHEFAAPWGSTAAIYARASSNNSESPLCLDQYLPDHLHVSGLELSAADAPLCAVSLKVNWDGSLDEAVVRMTGGGQGIDINAVSNLALSQGFPLRDTSIKMALPDASSVDVDLTWSSDETQVGVDHLSGTLKANAFNAGAWIPDMDLPAVISLEGAYSAQLSESATQLDQAAIDLTIADTSRWNGQLLQGHVMANVGRLEDAEVPELWQAYTIKNSDIDLQIGSNQLQMKGGFGLAEDSLKFLANAPDIKSLWPGLEEVGATKLEAQIDGSVFKHQLQAQLQHVLKAEDKEAKFGNGPVDAQFQLHGELDINSDTPSWRGQIDSISASHAGLGAAIAQAFPVDVLIPSAEQKLALDIGAFDIQATFDKKPWLRFHNDRTHLDDEGFSTKGHSYPVNISPKRIAALMQRLGLEEEDSTKRGGIVDKREPITVKDLVLQLEWDVTLKDALAGQLRLHRLEGDILVPAEPSFPLGLKEADVEININPGAGGRSMIEADINLETAKMGYIKAQGSTPIYYSKDTGFEIRDADRKELVVDAHMDSLAWTSLILGDEMGVGGELVATMRLHSTPDGGFESAGEITGKHLKITRLDDGVRLLDGDLKASLNNNRFTVEKLHFPALLRVEPKEWRTATWISENEDAKDGYLSITGYWDLEQNTGDFDVDLYRYPILQRSDRYAMVSGDLHMKAVLPQINLTGKITADAGWFDLDMLGGIPTIDSDVVVIRSTDPVKEKGEDEAAPIDISMNLNVDLGPRFYLTGYGVNSGLIGQMNIQMIDGQITALGAVNTRGGAIEVYGQRLQLRRGTITFQGDIANPLLDIQALRTGLAVDAGVKVGGTARKPKITLISVPEVSELEKLSWLLFGHGPDEGGGDLALLVSVGSSMLSDGEPFYKRFGIDEISMRSGELGGAGSILPATSTASTLETEISDVERRFIQASKALSSDITIGLRQALSDTGTVGRATYKLTNRLTAELSVGTVSGLALIYRWFSKE